MSCAWVEDWTRHLSATKHDIPLFLPHVSHLTELVIRHFHERVAHFGVNHTLNAICQRYWIIKAAVAVRRMISKCVSCRRRNSQPGRQLMAELPPARLQIDTPAFSHVGIDYFGPLMIRQRRATVKRYGCIHVYDNSSSMLGHSC